MDEFNSPENGNCKPLALIDCEFGNELIRKFLETWKDIFSKAVLLGYSKSKEFPEVEFIRKPLRMEALFTSIFGKVETQAGPTIQPVGGELLSNLRILIAEDNEVNQKLFKRILVTVGVDHENIILVNDGKEALELALKESFDLILMDLMMPVMGGIESTELILKFLPKEKQPLVFALTANVHVEDQVKCLEVGMSDVITKPINRNELREKLIGVALNLQKHKRRKFH